MVSLDTLLLCSACLNLFLALFFFTKIKGFVLIKLLLYKKRVYMHNGKRILFSEFFSIRKSIPPTVWVERKRFHFVHQKRYLFGQVTAQSKMYQGTLWILRQSYFWRQWVTESPKPLSQRNPFLIWQSSWICLWLLLTYKNYNMWYNKVEKIYLPQNTMLKTS